MMISKGRPAPKDRLKTHLEIERIDFPKNGDSENETPFTNGKFGYPYEMVNFKCAYYIIYISVYVSFIKTPFQCKKHCRLCVLLWLPLA